MSRRWANRRKDLATTDDAKDAATTEGGVEGAIGVVAHYRKPVRPAIGRVTDGDDLAVRLDSHCRGDVVARPGSRW